VHKDKKLLDKLHLILSQDTMLLSVHALGRNLKLILIEREVWSGEGVDPSLMPLLGF
jgi:hypothetical protein